MLRILKTSSACGIQLIAGVRPFATLSANTNHEVLLRDFLQRSLYDPEQGYFTSSSAGVPVGSIGQPLEFNNLLGQADYLANVKERYIQLQASWLTPSEIFTPYYGRSIANFILDKNSQMGTLGTPLHIFEIGAGTGTLARDILDHLRASVPDLYSDMRYHSIEISPKLAEVQQQTIGDAGHSDRFQVECRDAADLHGWEDSQGEEPCFFLLMEVLDNCSHDRVVRESASHPWQQTAVIDSQGSTGTSDVKEVLQPLEDDLIQRCLAVGPWEYNGKPLWHRMLDWAIDGSSQGAQNTLFLPTKCMLLLDTLVKARPFHCILAADFDHLPETKIPGKNAPLVATTVGGETIDHGTYLVEPGTSDIFFPTDFHMLERMYGVVAKSDSSSISAGVNSSVMKSEAFMKRYASIGDTTTVGGYNPLLQDYSNTSFFVGQRS